jgi:hypothetical protein
MGELISLLFDLTQLNLKSTFSIRVLLAVLIEHPYIFPYFLSLIKYYVVSLGYRLNWIRFVVSVRLLGILRPQRPIWKRNTLAENI